MHEIYQQCFFAFQQNIYSSWLELFYWNKRKVPGSDVRMQPDVISFKKPVCGSLERYPKIGLMVRFKRLILLRFDMLRTNKYACYYDGKDYSRFQEWWLRLLSRPDKTSVTRI